MVTAIAQAETGARPTRTAHRDGRTARRRLGLLAIHLGAALALVTIVFALPRAMPGDPLAALGGADADFGIDPAARERALAFYGLDEPLWSQYASYLGGIVRGDLGWSMSHNTPVTELVAAHLPWTLGLAGLAIVLSSVLAFVAGAAAAWWRGTPLDRALVTVLTGLRAVPEYVVASLLLIALAVLVPLFPLAGGKTPFATYDSTFAVVADLAHHGALPLAALTVSLLGTSFLLVRGTMSRELASDHVELARAKGLPSVLVAGRHAARGALVPFFAIVGIRAGLAVGGAVFVEAVFSYPGMGTLVLDAVQARDYPVLEGAFLTLVFSVLTVNAVVELVANRLDPRRGVRPR